MNWIKPLLHRFKSLPYEEQKKMAYTGALNERLSLAKSSKTNREILFYLAENDPNEIVRKRVASNKMTPYQANHILSTDAHEDIRLALSGRLVKLLPKVSFDKQSQIYAYTVQALGDLALDEVLKIRKSLAVTLKDLACAPPSVAAQLARDIEREVAEPILRFCVALDDDVLIDILKTHPKAWAAEIVAQRNNISAKVSRAVIETYNKKAGKNLLENKGAEINEELLHEIILRAQDFPEWHQPLVTRHKLPQNMARQLARYTDARLRKLLQDKGNFTLDESEVVVDATRRRIELEQSIKGRQPSALKKEIKSLALNNELNEDLISDHLALRDLEFFYEAVAYKIGTNASKIKNVLALKKPEVICSVCWKAGLSMRFAFRVQQEVSGIFYKELIVPRDGTDYPLSTKDMQWHIDFLDIQ